MRWPRSLLFFPIAAVFAGGCSLSGSVIDSPPVVVGDWLVSVGGSEFDTASEKTFQPALAIVIAVENDLSTGQTAAFLTEGIPASVSAAYWSSFQEGFGAFAGYPLSALDVGGSEEIFTEGVRFAAVEVTDPEDGGGIIFTRDDPARQIDLVATLASGFVDPLRRTYDLLPGTEEGDIVRVAYRDTVVPAMWAAISSGQYDDDFTRQALALIDAVAMPSLPSP